MEEIEKMKTYIEQSEVYNDAMKSLNYKQSLFLNHKYSDDAQKFINETIEKYKKKEELKNYKFPTLSDNKSCKAQFEGLCWLERILMLYSLIKYAEECDKNE